MKRVAVFLLLSAAAIPIAAQSDEDSASRGIARLSVMNGDVSIRRGDSGELIAAALNAPLVVTDRVLTGVSSRAELQFDWANVMRIGSNAEVRLSVLDARRYQIQLAAGTTTLGVLRDNQADVEISTPTVSVRPLALGSYRVTVYEDGSTQITVRNGEAEVFTPGGSERLRPGTTMLARGSESGPEYRNIAAIPMDDWDRWNEDRDRLMRKSDVYQHVSSDIDGAEDLDGHGRWVTDDTYGAVWAPAVAPGWAPYQLGRWVWVDYYGWTWVSYDPWGWAPYHYGRWFHSASYGWCWWPGGVHTRHYWRPALVAFFGWGSYSGYQTGIGFGYGNIGWVPLGPHEVFHPWYGRGLYGGRTENSVIVNNVNIVASFRNARAVNGITSVRRDVFGRRAIGGSDLVHVDDGHLRGAGVVRGVLPVTPGRESLRMADRSAQAPAISRRIADRTFFSRGRTSSARTVPFEQQRQSIERVAEKSFGNRLGSYGPTEGRGSVTGQGTPAPQAGGWRRIGEPVRAIVPPIQDRGSAGGFGEPGQRGTVVKRPAAVNPRSEGWRRFGEPGSRPVRGSVVSAPEPGAANAEGYGEARTGFGAYGPEERSNRSYGSSSLGSQQPVRISPPIVRERPSYRTPAPSSNGRSGGGMSRPTQSTPSSRGGGGSNRNGGGGGRSRGR